MSAGMRSLYGVISSDIQSIHGGYRMCFAEVRQDDGATADLGKQVTAMCRDALSAVPNGLNCRVCGTELDPSPAGVQCTNQSCECSK